MLSFWASDTRSVPLDPDLLVSMVFRQLSVQFTMSSITLEQAIHTRFAAIEPARAVYLQDLSKVQNVFVLVRQDLID